MHAFSVSNSLSPVFHGTPAKADSASDKESKRVSENDYKKHETYAKLAADCVSDESKDEIDGFNRIVTLKNEKTGFNSALYGNPAENEVVVAYRCTNNKEGVCSDVKMLEEKLPYQYKDAVRVYNFTKKAYPDSDITLVGHSLGGSLAQLTASTYEDASAVTFDPYGTAAIIKKEGLKDHQNCVNYAANGSLVSGVSPHPGITKTVNVGVKSKLSKDAPASEIVKKLHEVKNYENLEEADFANEETVSIMRDYNYETLTKPAGRYLKVIPASEKVVSSFFFNDGSEPLPAGQVFDFAV